jgi:hypothetical protein
MLRTRRPTAELFVDPSPPAGLIVIAGIDVDRLSRRCRTIGVEIVAEGHVVRARSAPPPRLTPPRGIAKSEGVDGVTGVRPRPPPKDEK